MSFDLNYWLKETIHIICLAPACFYQDSRPRIVCNDGYSVSVQACQYSNCKPCYTQWQNEDGWQVMSLEGNFETDHYTPYESVELDYPSKEDEFLNEYAKTDKYKGIVYPFVPVEVVEKLIEKHGGFKGADKSNLKGETE